MKKQFAECSRGFSVLSQAWYGKDILSRTAEISDTITIGMYHLGGGTAGEFSIRWYSDASKAAPDIPRLEVYSGSWNALWMFSDLLERLCDLDDKKPQPSDVVKVLNDLGVKDRTIRTLPGTPILVSKCPCCKQPLQTGHASRER